MLRTEFIQIRFLVNSVCQSGLLIVKLSDTSSATFAMSTGSTPWILSFKHKINFPVDYCYIPTT